MSFSISSVKVRHFPLRSWSVAERLAWTVAYHPSTIRLVLLDLGIAVLQFVVLILAFGQAIGPQSTAATETTDEAIEGEDRRTVEELSALLGEEFEEDESDMVASAFSPSPHYFMIPG